MTQEANATMANDTQSTIPMEDDDEINLLDLLQVVMDNLRLLVLDEAATRSNFI